MPSQDFRFLLSKGRHLRLREGYILCYCLHAVAVPEEVVPHSADVVVGRSYVVALLPDYGLIGIWECVDIFASLRVQW